jgi:hypothetical protein
VGAQSFHMDGRTDMKIIVAFCNFAGAPKNCVLLTGHIFIIIIIIMLKKGGLGVLPDPLILQVKLVRPYLPRSSYVPLSVWSVMQCLSWYSVFVHPLYML